jgi:hypothetical protein
MADFSMNVNYAKPQVTSLGDMLGMASGIQNFQQAQQLNPLVLQRAQQEVEQARQMNPLALEKAQIENQVLKQKNDERLKLQEFTSNPTNWQTNGRIDMDKINAVIPKIAPLTGSDVISSLSGLHKNQTEAASAKQALTQTERSLIGNVDHSLGLMGVNDPKQIIKAYQGLIKNNPDNSSLERMINLRIDLLKQAQAGPAITKDLLAESASLLSIPQQRAEFAPKVSLTPTGSELKETITTPMSPSGQAPSISMTGRAEPLTIGPGQPQVAVEGNPYGLPVGTTYIPPSAATKQQAPMVTGLAPQIASTIGANTTIANQDWQDTYNASKEAQPRIAIFQNIKKIAPEGFTGVGAERKKLAAGILNAAGIDAYTAENTATDELAKNTRLLALAGGNTDAARAMAEIANPSGKMTLQAIKEVSDQMIGVERLKEKRAEYLGQFRNDPVKYQEKSQLFNQFADPRIFQEMTPEQVAKLKASMSKQDIADMSRKIQQAKMLGIIK